MTTLSAAGSHTGKVRINNQDSGYAGTHLFLVADGMGGHAGGDVASALATQTIAQIDRLYDSAEEARAALTTALLEANQELADTVFEHPELTGMGTTVSGIVRVGPHLALAHIGDSRIYRWRDGALTQVTKDHTFVQRLVDSGRITAEEAAVHPRRSVLMRVLGDVDLTPEVDSAIVDTQPGDRWLLCSDGLSGFVSEERMGALLAEHSSAVDAVDALIDESLDEGAPDNVTVVVVDVHADESGAMSSPPTFVGSAAQPLSFAAKAPKRSVRLPSLLLHPLKPPTDPDDEHFEPESEEFYRELIAEDARRKVRRRITWTIGLLLVIGLVVGALAAGYQWTQSRYFVGESDGQVAIFQGVQQNIGPFPLSSVYLDSGIAVDELDAFSRQRVESTINAESLADALSIVDRLRDELR